MNAFLDSVTLPPNARTLDLPAGAVLFRPDDACPGFVVVEEGAIRVSITSEQGREIVLYRVTPGAVCLQTFACLVEGKTYAAEGKVEAPLRGVLIPPGAFADMMRDQPAFSARVFAAIAHRFHEFEHLVETLAFTGLEARLSEALLKLCDEDGVVTATHEALAAEIGSAREAVSRVLGRWAQEGRVDLSRGKVRVVKRTALERFVML